MTPVSANPLLAHAQAGSPLSDLSRFAQRVRRRYRDQMHLLPDGLPDRQAMEIALQALIEDIHDIGAALRVLRQLVIERLVVLDCDNHSSLDQVTSAMTHLAEFSLDMACAQAVNMTESNHGRALTVQGEPAVFWVLGMGKLGARELNVSSDIDLVYVYDQEGETAGRPDGRGQISNQEFYSKVVRAVYRMIGDTTEHGFVFRVDLALRPNGNSGPAVVSIGALEEYFHVQGREWERFAWLKSRVVSPAERRADGSAITLRNTVVAFVFRRYLDYGVFDALRILHRQIREHAAKRSAGHPERANDVKLSRGGIREIEFTVQLLQVVRGGQFPELRTRPTLNALKRLARAGLMPEQTAQTLADAYVFLRRVEHRIQYLDDQQTHLLPTNDSDLNWIAHTLGFSHLGPFLSHLDAHREAVAQEFDKLLGGYSENECKGCLNGQKNRSAEPDFDQLLVSLPEAFGLRVQAWRNHPRVQALREVSRSRLIRLVARTALWLKEGTVTEVAAVRLVDWMEPLMRRESYIALLLERPNAHARLLRLLGAAKWPARYLLLHPGVIDELASADMLNERFVPTDFERELEFRRSALQSAGDDDEESLLNLLRRAHHAEVFRTLSRDLEKTITVEQVADDLSSLAETVLRITCRWCWERLKRRHRESHQFAIIAYGKLGGKELGYGSDLDIVFVYEDDDEQASEVYANLVRKLINWLTVKTGEGDLYEIDTALRPNGNSGLLVTSFSAYANYQQQRGSNTAWTWEHQAMTRARFVLGNDALRQRFDQIRAGVITAPRDSLKLADEIKSMRIKVTQAHPVSASLFDVKHSPGGMVDVEFVVQFLVLSLANTHPQLVANIGNIALLKAAESQGLLPASIGEAAASAYRELRRVQHLARLNEEPTQVDFSMLQAERQAVLNLWHAVFGPL
jgi:glutamate-ammonia-ligase adenylyltransferase